MTDSPFHYDVEESEDEYRLKLTTIKCHGRLTGEAASQLKALVTPLISQGAQHVVIDFTDLAFLDSSGLGTLAGLKVSSINKGLGKLELVNLSPRVRELVTITNLTELFAK
jgi:anti-sigma B factor antagonist